MAVFRLLISGNVQGVGFRFGVKQFVLMHLPEISGFVRNLYSGEVEIVANLTPDQLEKLKSFCQNGIPAAEVDSIDVTLIAEKMVLPATFTVNKNI